jgi:hypothetical protein
MTQATPDFIAHFGQFSTVWTITAETESAKDFAKENFQVEDWQGVPENFMTDHRPARNICSQLADNGFIVGCKQIGFWKGNLK